MNKITVTKAVKVTFGGGACPEYTVELPEGLKVSSAPAGGSAKAGFWVDEFPEDIFPKGSMILHDAEHYGIRLTPEQVLELNQFWFNTGVRPDPTAKPPIGLYADQQWRGGTKQIPFYADAPENAHHQFLCDDPDRPEGKIDGWMVRPVYNTSMVSKYCYFRVPKES